MGSGRRHGTRVAGCRDRWHARSRAGARCRAEIAEKLEDPNIHLPHGTVIDSKAALSPGIRVTELDPRRSVMWPVDGRPIGKAAELFSALQVGHHLGTDGANRTRAPKQATTHTLIDLALLLRNAYMLASLRIEHGEFPETPPPDLARALGIEVRT